MLVKEEIQVKGPAKTEYKPMEFLRDTLKCTDLEQGIRDACVDYANTEEGSKWENSINWETFWEEVPNSICEKYGFRKLTGSRMVITVDPDTNLAGYEHCELSLANWEEMKTDLLLHPERAETFLQHVNAPIQKGLELDTATRDGVLEEVRKRVPLNILSDWYADLRIMNTGKRKEKLHGYLHTHENNCKKFLETVGIPFEETRLSASDSYRDERLRQAEDKADPHLLLFWHNQYLPEDEKE